MWVHNKLRKILNQSKKAFESRDYETVKTFYETIKDTTEKVIETTEKIKDQKKEKKFLIEPIHLKKIKQIK